MGLKLYQKRNRKTKEKNQPFSENVCNERCS